MQIKKCTSEMLPTVLKIYDDARKYMRENKNPTQWGDCYPPLSLLEDDIASGNLYVCVEQDEIIGVFCHYIGSDPTYEVIYDGKWLNSLPYGVIHRIAVAKHKKGVASFCFDYCFSRCGNLKIDTHANNIPMQRSLAKNGFKYCGIIHLENGEERIAYQKFNQDM